MKSRVPFLRSLLAAGLAVLAVPQVTSAQLADGATLAPESSNSPNYYGQGVNSLMIPGTAFVPSDSNTRYEKPFLFLTRTAGGGSSEFTHALTLPPGALIESVTAYVTDGSATQNVTLRMCILFALPGSGTTQDLDCDEGIGVPPVATAGAPGSTALVSNVNRTFLNLQDFGTGTNYDTSHVILVHLDAADGTHKLHSVKVQWRRQISPPPAVASFSDVPTGNLFFQHVEALKASGITLGCTTDLYCPDQSVTRAQMAAFLARALGLHWAP